MVNKDIENIVNSHKIAQSIDEFGGFDSNKAHSSTLFVSDSRFVKQKTRSLEKTVWEYLMLDLLKPILESYNQSISCPKPEGFIAEGIVMEFLPTTSAEYVLSKINGKEKIQINNTDLPFANYMLEKLGELSRIKELEGVIHGDYQLRHVLISRSGQIYLIDVENAYIDGEKLAISETAGLKDQICSTRGPNALTAFMKGYNLHNTSKHSSEKEIENLFNKYGIELNFIDRKITKY